MAPSFTSRMKIWKAAGGGLLARASNSSSFPSNSRIFGKKPCSGSIRQQDQTVPGWKNRLDPPWKKVVRYEP